LEDHEILARRLVGTLNATELQVLRCLVGGMSNKHICGVAGLSMAEVERARAAMMDKLNARRTADAVRLGLFAGVDLSG
jgi:FixJ family two-component response regulator